MNSTPNHLPVTPSDSKSPSDCSAAASPNSIQIQVNLFALARQLAGRPQIELTLTSPATIAAVRQALAEQAPPLTSLLPHSMFAIGTDYAGDDSEVRDGDQLAMIPPVSGG